MPLLTYLIPATGLFALIVAFGLAAWIRRNKEGTPRMMEVASCIRKGAMAFLLREYRPIAVFIVIMFPLLAFTPIGVPTASAFLLGAVFSVSAGFVGMRTATTANVRTTAAARTGIFPALKIAFRGGAVMGLTVVGLGVFGIGVLLIILGFENSEIITGFGLGASSIALFDRVGGGIYTKAADIGADIAGKIELGIPEDDPRNPASVADNVGDNVGDVAGMGSDLFESYVGSIISAIMLAVAGPSMISESMILYPVLIACAGVLASIIAVFIVGRKNSKNPAATLLAGTYISSLLVLISGFFLSLYLFGRVNEFAAVASGIAIGISIGVLSKRYTYVDYKSVKKIAKQADTGAANTIIEGLSVGMMSTVAPLLLISASIIISNEFVGLYGIALSSVGMLSTTGIVVAVDAYGPISDNAGGIAVMSGLPHNVREITDELDSVGNTTAAIGKGFAIGSAALTALALFVSYAEIAGLETISLLDPWVVSGLLVGGILPFLFAALTMRRVSRAASQIIEEIRSQFRSNKDIWEGKTKPDYSKCENIATSAALRGMIVPCFLAVACPILAGLINVKLLGGLLAGSMLTGVLLAITMSIAGGAWDNAKKYIEIHGGEGSNAHKAAIVGDTVGDPLKDTCAPSMNILIKLMAIVAVVFLPLFLR